jgi:hypothetical protein
MQRLLQDNVDLNAGFVTKKEFYRIAAENHLIDDAAVWWEFHEARNQSSHVYDGAIAEDVFETGRRFLPYAEKLLETLKNIR